MFELLDLSGCNTNKEVTSKISDRVKKISIEKLIEEVGEDFVQHENVTKKIYAALATGNNAMLYGPGGFGKSEIIKAVCKVLGIPVICKIGYEDMTAEELLGIPNIGKLMEESRYETAFENSLFANRGILILEEFFDCNPQTAAALKDILTEKGFREGSEKKESLISTVIITGNKEPDEMSTNDSTAAFYLERFPYRHKMIWEEFEPRNYFDFFKVYYKDDIVEDKQQELKLVSKLCASNSTTVSPRVSVQAADTAINLGIEFLDTIDAIDTSMIEEIKSEVFIETLLEDNLVILSRVKKQFKNFTSKNIADIVTGDFYKLLELRHRVLVLKEVKKKLESVEFVDEAISEYKSVILMIDNELESYKEYEKLSFLNTSNLSKDLNDFI